MGIGPGPPSGSRGQIPHRYRGAALRGPTLPGLQIPDQGQPQQGSPATPVGSHLGLVTHTGSFSALARWFGPLWGREPIWGLVGWPDAFADMRHGSGVSGKSGQRERERADSESMNPHSHIGREGKAETQGCVLTACDSVALPGWERRPCRHTAGFHRPLAPVPLEGAKKDKGACAQRRHPGQWEVKCSPVLNGLAGGWAAAPLPGQGALGSKGWCPGLHCTASSQCAQGFAKEQHTPSTVRISAGVLAPWALTGRSYPPVLQNGGAHALFS